MYIFFVCSFVSEGVDSLHCVDCDRVWAVFCKCVCECECLCLCLCLCLRLCCVLSCCGWVWFVCVVGSVLCLCRRRGLCVFVTGRAAESCCGLCVRCMSGTQTEARERVWRHGNLRRKSNYLHQRRGVPVNHD